jgi:anti-sigma factor RsiW
MGSPADKTDQMSAYLDEQLSPAEAAEFEAFLESSAEAREEMDDLRKMLAVVGRLAEVKAPPGFYERVTRTMRRRRLWGGEGIWAGLSSLPFQVLSIVLILAVAVTYMLLQLDRDRAHLEKDPDRPEVVDGAEEGGPGP